MSERDRMPLKLSIALTPALNNRVEQLEVMTGAKSKSDVVREALRLYEYFVKQAAAGNQFAITKHGKFETVILFGLNAEVRTQNE